MIVIYLTDRENTKIITRDNEVIMFSPGVFVCVCVYVCHDVRPDDLLVPVLVKYWCHTYNILQEYRWGYLVVHVMCCILMTPLLTSAGRKVSHILKILGQLSSYSVEIL